MQYSLWRLLLNILLALHNLNRWIVVVLIVVVLVRAYAGWLQKKGWVDLDRRVSLWTTIALDVQLLLGLVLYLGDWLPLWSDVGAVMSTPLLRLFALEHPFYALLAVIAAHVGSSGARRTADALAQHRFLALAFSLVMLFILVGMPWSRPLLRGF